MPSAKKSEKSKGAGSVTASDRSSGSGKKASSKAARTRGVASTDAPPASRGASKTSRSRVAAKTNQAKPSEVRKSSTTKASGGAGTASATRTRAAAKTAAKTSEKRTAKTAAVTSQAAAETSARRAASRAAVSSSARSVATVKSSKAPAKADTAKQAQKRAAPARTQIAEKAKSAEKQIAAPAMKAPGGKTDKAPAARATAATVAPKSSIEATLTRAPSPPSPVSSLAIATPGAAGKSPQPTTAGEEKELAKKTETPAVSAAPAANDRASDKPAIETRPVASKAAAPAAGKSKASGQKHGFKLNEFIVYPAHGVGQIVGVEIQEVAGFSLELFVVSFIKDKMILKVPTSKVANVGMRKLAETNVVDKALATLSGRARIKRTMWSRRAQEYEAKINSGDLVTIAEVVRDLYRSDTQPEQSYSERQLYEAALDRMAREIAAVRRLIDSEALKLIESFLQKGPRRGQKTDADAGDDGDVDDADVDRAA